MPYDLRQWPATVYPREADQFPECMAAIDHALRQLRDEGPSLEIYGAKNLGKRNDYLWQINLRVNRKQIRVLYAPYNRMIVVFRIHQKSSPQEQRAAYTTASRRKREAELRMKQHGAHGLGGITIH